MSTPSTDSNRADLQEDAAWGFPDRGFRRWPALLAIAVAVLLYITLPGHLYYGPVWALPAIEIVLFLALLTAQRVTTAEQRWQRTFALGLIAILNAANVGSLLLLVHALLSHAPIDGKPITAPHLVVWSAQIWLTNVLVFALWYWELDRGGPAARTLPHHRNPDLLFPQMTNPDVAPTGWAPTFLDYLFTSFTNAAAFSPTDTLPLTHWAKALFMIQATASILTAVLVIARIANILP